MPFEDRLTLSFIAKVSENGEISSLKFAPSIIQSKMRMTYEDVNLFLEDTIFWTFLHDSTSIKSAFIDIHVRHITSFRNKTIFSL